MKTHQYQGVMNVGGKEVMGLLHVSFGKNRATITFKENGQDRAKRVATFSKTKWLDQDEVNTELRARGLLWHRSVSELEYAKRAAKA